MVRPPDLAPNLTTRERFAQHSADPLCAACHKLMDPIGLGFENYDAARAVAGHRERHARSTPRASFVAPTSTAPSSAPLELTGKLLEQRPGAGLRTSSSGSASATAGRRRPRTLCSVETLKALYDSKGRNARELLVALTQTDAFMFRRAGGAP